MAGGQGSMHLNRPAYPPSQQQQQQPPPSASAQPSPPPSFPLHIAPPISSLSSPVPPPHQPYPGLSSIPGMHSTASSLAALHAPAMPPPNPSIPALHHSFSNIPMPPFSNLIHHAQDPHTHTQPLSSSHLSNPFASPAPRIAAGIDKKRLHSRKPRLPAAYASLLVPEDTHSILIGPHSHNPQHHDPAAALPHSVPTYEADGIQFKILEQLPDTKINRLKTEKIKPIEHLTFTDIKAYNRNQLRAYCSVYGIRRKKKAEMERDMARYAALFHPNDPAYDFSKFLPTEYADGPIPRRKVPVTKEQKEQAAGDMKRLTNALQQRPQSAVVAHQQQHQQQQHHYTTASATNSAAHQGISAAAAAAAAAHGLHHHPSSVVSSASRLHDIHGTHSTAHTTQHLGAHTGHHDSEDQGVVGAADLMSVPEMQVPNHLLQITNQIGEE